MANLDELVLSGAFSHGVSGSSSPARSQSTRSASPTSKWPGEDFEDSDIGTVGRQEDHQEPPLESIGMGPGRTGVKGVIRDQAEAMAKEKSKVSMRMSALNQKLEATSLAAGGRTWQEDEDERRIEKGLEPIQKPKSGATGKPPTKYGYLREVGMANYVEAIEDPNARVIVHIYDPSLERCHELDATLAKLARTSPRTKFIRVKATSIGFALKKASETGALGASSKGSKIRGDQEKYILSEDSTFPEDEYDEEDEAEADTDMLPTMLIYEHGELRNTWIRVDWEAGKDGVENLLLKHNLITRKSQPGAQGIAALSDDEDDEDDY